MKIWTRARRSTPDAAAAFTPAAVQLSPRHIQIGNDWATTLAITGYARDVYPGWLGPLLRYPGRVDISLHITPVDPTVAAARMQGQLARLESGRRHSASHGKLSDPLVEAATGDAYEMSNRLACGEGRLFQLGVYLTVHAHTEAELAEEVSAVRALAASVMMHAVPLTHRPLQGWITTLPTGLDLIKMTRTFDTPALAAAFPFDSPDLPGVHAASAAEAGGVLYGMNLGGQSLVHHDRFARAGNHNSVVIGKSGAGKSFFLKLEVLRSLYCGTTCTVIDPADEYARLAAAAGGVHLRLGAGVRLNPFDLPLYRTKDGSVQAPPSAVKTQAQFIHTVVAVIAGKPSPEQTPILDAAIARTYAAAGISNDDPRTWDRPAPVLADLRAQLAAMGPTSEHATALAARLYGHTEGAFNALFDGPTTTPPEGRLVVYSLRELRPEMKAIATLLVLERVWRQVSDPFSRAPHLVTVDEAAMVMKDPVGAEFLEDNARGFRKLGAGLTIATQEPGDVLATPQAKAIINNSDMRVVLGQMPQHEREIVDAFKLSGPEWQFVSTAHPGQGLLIVGAHRVMVQGVASPFEYDIAHTTPADRDDSEDETSAAAQYLTVKTGDHKPDNQSG